MPGSHSGRPQPPPHYSILIRFTAAFEGEGVVAGVIAGVCGGIVGVDIAVVVVITVVLADVALAVTVYVLAANRAAALALVDDVQSTLFA